MENKAKEIVRNYIITRNDTFNTLNESVFNVFIVWQCKTLQNWKFLISTNLADNKYYELTYNGDAHEWYLDAYSKIENVCIKEDAQ